MLDLSLRAEGSWIRGSALPKLAGVYRVADFEVTTRTWTPEAALPSWVPHGVSLGADVDESWLYSVLPGRPELSGEYRTISIFFPDLKEVIEKASLQGLTYNFAGAGAWFHVGIQVLHASGCGPDYILSDRLDIKRILPPRADYDRFIFGNHVGTPLQEGPLG